MEAAIREEMSDLADLVELLRNVHDSKLTALLNFLDGIFSVDPDEKVIVFTQFIETQLFLREQLSARYSVQIFNGSSRASMKRTVLFTGSRRQIRS